MPFSEQNLKDIAVSHGFSDGFRRFSRLRRRQHGCQELYEVLGHGDSLEVQVDHRVAELLRRDRQFGEHDGHVLSPAGVEHLGKVEKIMVLSRFSMVLRPKTYEKPMKTLSVSSSFEVEKGLDALGLPCHGPLRALGTEQGG